MKMRITLLSMLVGLGLAIFTLPANASTIYNNGAGVFGATAPCIGHCAGFNNATSNQILCATSSCTPTDITFYALTPTNDPVPTNEPVSWNFASGPNLGVGFNSGTSITPSAVPCTTNGAFNLCIITINLTGTLSQPASSWLTLSGMENDVLWAFSPTATNMAQTCITNAAGACGPTLAPIQGEGFSVSGTAVPEPSSMLLVGSGVIGLAGILRRKLTR